MVKKVLAICGLQGVGKDTTADKLIGIAKSTFVEGKFCSLKFFKYPSTNCLMAFLISSCLFVKSS